MSPMWLQGTTLQQTFKIPKETPHFREGRMSFVDEEGNKRYIKRISPFFEDEQRDVFEDITEQ